MKKQFFIISFIVFVALLVLVPVTPVLADCETGNLLPPCTCSGQCQLTDFLALGSNIMQYGVGILAAVAIGFFIHGGFTLLMAMGNPEKIEAGKKILGGAFKGVAMVMLSWILVSTIIFFTTGNSSGLLFGRGNEWWQFEETQLHEMYLPREAESFCPVRVAAAPKSKDCSMIIYQQTCYDTTLGQPGWGVDEGTRDAALQEGNCRSLGVCEGNAQQLCCDSPDTEIECPDGNEIRRYLTGE